MGKTLEQYTAEEINDEAARLNQLYGAEGGLQEYFRWIGSLREECFERKAAQMDPTGDLTAWAEQMAVRHGPKVRIFRSSYTWRAALGVVRYGEAPGHWPAEFTPDDVIRAKRWLYQNDVPEGASYILAEG